MKFSWNILNYFINLNSINLKKFTTKLILSGFEIEEVTNIHITKDKIINLNITANRKDIHCIFNLAQEISTICDLPLKIPIFNINSKFNHKISINNNFIKNSKEIIHIQINTIHNIKSHKSPKWLKNHLISYDIKSLYLLHDIQQYIKIKWGHEFFIHDIEKIHNNTKIINTNLINIDKCKKNNYQEKILYKNEELINFSNTSRKQIKEFNYKTKTILLCFACYEQKNKINKNLQENLENAYYETIQLIQTFGKGTINKLHQYINKNNDIKNKYKIELKTNAIKKILGPIKEKNKKFLSTKQIIYSLKQLKTEFKYINKYKNFEVLIPNYRKNDLYRSIDIIEEIGRIYGFEKFINEIPKFSQKGTISSKSFYIKKIKSTLKGLGLNEVINSSLNDDITSNNRIHIYNPITQENTFLRTNIINNLLRTYENNKKQKNFRTEIFEVGQIFYKNNENKYLEETHLGILIKNKEFIRENWSHNAKNLEFFHVKGIIEIFLHKLKCNIIWENLNFSESNNHLMKCTKIIKQNKTLGIYNKKNNKLIGFLSELNYQIHNIKYENNNHIYILEINVNELIKTIKFNKHLTNRIQSQSIYPNVTRDISINITKEQKINEIKKFIEKQNSQFLESIELINEYHHKNINVNTKSICLRITYQSKNKTLNNEDINTIDKNIEKILKKFQITKNQV
uniref:phenylalanine--tRNA ligase n=1 Tax=Dictyurus purpurascens TaxID=189649 RepID=A0A4D6WRP4_9FLOR|nr:Phenylalanine-tRNA ligase beta subunit [Dictyurus purpurascens]